MEISFSFPRRGLPSRGGSLLALSAATSTLCFQVSFAARWIRAAIKGGAGEEGNNKIRGASRVFPSFANQPRENKRGEEGKGSRSLSCFGRGLNRGRVIFLALRARVPFRGRRRGADIISLAAVSFLLLLLFFFFLLACFFGSWEIWSMRGSFDQSVR